MSLVKKLIRDRLMNARNNNVTEQNESATKRNLKQETIDAIAEVENLFPGASDLLKETAIIESKMGGDVRAGANVFQLTETGIDAIKDIKSHPNLKKYHQKIKNEFGLDIMNMSYSDFKENPKAGALAARMIYANVPDAIPSDVEGRAAYWKKHYNSKADEHGTAEAYVKQVGEFKY